MKEKERMLDKNNMTLNLEKMTKQSIGKHQVSRIELPKKRSLQEKGITLIALVVTIIILLILAGVTLNMALSQNGLFSKTQEVADNYKQAQDDEELEIEKIEYAAEGKDIKEVEKISSKEEFTKFREEVNNGDKNFENTLVKLYCDINLENEEWTPIGTSTNPFTGVFNGNGHKISNIKISKNENDFQGLFGVCNGIIKNVGIESGVIGGKRCAGGIVGLGNNCTIENCYNKADITVDGGNSGYAINSGGILGRALLTSEKVLISRCFNTGTIKLNEDTTGENTGSGAAGICGVSGRCVEIEDCFNKGKVSTKSNGQNPMAGGISTGGGFIKYCYNLGYISCEGTREASRKEYVAIGGICAQTTGEIIGCYNLGKIIFSSNETGALRKGLITGLCMDSLIDVFIVKDDEITGAVGVKGNSNLEHDITTCESKEDLVRQVVSTLSDKFVEKDGEAKLYWE